MDVWKRVKNYQPKVVVIEFNPTIPTNIRFVQEANPGVNQGASLLSLVELGKEKGYELVCVLPFNAFFVKREFLHLFHLDSNEPETLRTDLSAITYLFSGYDGRVFLRGACKLPWHGIKLREKSVQPLPRFFRKYPGSYTFSRKIVFRIFSLVRRLIGLG